MIIKLCTNSKVSQKNEDLKVTYDTTEHTKILDAFEEIINERYTIFNFYTYTIKLLRLMQTLSGLGITILTFNNNPYYTDYEELINIYLWYLALFSTLTNTSLEIIQNKYDIYNNRIIIDLLKIEQHKLYKKYCPYNDLNSETPDNKIKYFKSNFEKIDGDIYKTPITYLRRPTTPPKQPQVQNFINQETESLQNNAVPEPNNEHEESDDDDQDNISFFTRLYRYTRNN